MCLIEGQMHSLSVPTYAEMHRTGMCGCEQHGRDIVVSDAALTVFRLSPALYCNSLILRESVTTP